MSFQYQRASVLLTTIATTSLVLAGLQDSASAYLDPGQGSILLQSLLAGGAGLAVVVKMYWFKIKTLFVRK